MIDDLRYPPGLIASPYWERKISTLKSGVGSMPGVPLSPEYFDILQGGRGVIPGTAKFQEATLGLVVDRQYPDSDVYSGPAHEGKIIFHSPRLSFLNDWVEKVATNYVEKTVIEQGGRMLSLEIYIATDWWTAFPTYRWTLVFNFYIPGEQLGIAKASATAIITGIVLLLALIALIFVLKQVKEIIWGPPDKPGFGSLLMIGGGLALAFMILKPKTKRKKK